MRCEKLKMSELIKNLPLQWEKSECKRKASITLNNVKYILRYSQGGKFLQLSRNDNKKEILRYWGSSLIKFDRATSEMVHNDVILNFS